MTDWPIVDPNSSRARILELEDELARLRDEVQRVTQHVEWLESQNVRFRDENTRLREELKDTRENSWGLDEATAYTLMEDERDRLREVEAAVKRCSHNREQRCRHIDEARNALKETPGGPSAQGR